MEGNSLHIEFASGKRVPFEWNAPITLKQNRGLDPWMFSIALSDSDNQLPNPSGSRDGEECTFVFQTPDTFGSGMTTFRWEGMYLVRVEPGVSEESLKIATFADERWRASHHRRDMQYNIQWPDGTYRSDSVLGDGRPWKAIDAIKDALDRFGYRAVVSAKLNNEVGGRVLPNNLGNTDSGGFVFASMAEVLPPMLESIDCDIIFRGKVPHIVARTGDQERHLERLFQEPRIQDTVSQGRNKWELPRKLRVGFEVQLEVALDSGGRQQTSTGGWFDPPENVMLEYEQRNRLNSFWWEPNFRDRGSDSQWVGIHRLLVSEGYANDLDDAEDLICRYYFLPNMPPIPRNDQEAGFAVPADEVLKRMWIDGQIRNFWRTYWRIKFPQDANPNGHAPVLRHISGLKFGRLTPGGDTVSQGAVYADWCEELILAVNGPGGDPFTKEWSINHPFSSETTAPFSARWVSESGAELVFALEAPPSKRINQKRSFLGLFARNLNYGRWADVAADGYLEFTELQGTFKTDFDFRVIMTGKLISEPQTVTLHPNMVNRTYVLERDMFPDGGLEYLDVKSRSLTANFGFTKEQQKIGHGLLGKAFPQNLLNDNELEQKADDVASRMKDAMKAGLAGNIVTPGVEAASKGYGTGGDIHEFSVVVGNPDPWSIKCNFIVLPGVAAVDVDPKERDGRKPKLIDADN